MADKDFKQIIATVKESYDIVDYIESSGVSLKHSGSKYSGLCPFHNERTPSFHVDTHFQSYKCFGCGVGGDILSYVQEHHSLDFKDALTVLAQDKNISLEGVFSAAQEDDGPKVDIQSLRELMKETGTFFWRLYQKLPEDHVAKQEISERKLTTENSHNIYGYAPEGGNRLYSHLSEKGYSDDLIETSGVCKKSERTGRFFDFWQGRLMFIITDITGRVVGFSGRKLHDTDKMGKYVNSSESPVFDKSSLLFNSSLAKKPASQHKEVFVVEGQFDVMSIIEAGKLNAVAPLGTAFTARQSSALRRMVGESGKIVFFFDPDEAGQKAAEKIFGVDPLLHSMSEVVIPSENKDPNDYGRDNGYDALKEYIENPKNRLTLTEFVLRASERRHDMSSAEGRAKYVEDAAEVLSMISSVSLRREYTKRVSLISRGVPVSDIEQMVAEAEKKGKDLATKREQRKKNNVETTESDEDDAGVSDDRAVLSSDDETARKAKKVIKAMRTQNYHKHVGRLLWMSLSRQDLFSETVYKIRKSLLPKFYHLLVEELYNHDMSKPIFPERFTDALIAEEIIENYRPSSHITPEDDQGMIKLFDTIVRHMIIDRTREKRASRRSEILPLLSYGKSSPKLLKQVIDEHKKEKESVDKIMEKLISSLNQQESTY